MLVAFVFWELRNRHPMLDMHLFKNPRFSVASGGITLVFFAMFGLFFMLAQYLQGVLGYSPLGAAVRLLPISVVMMVVAPQTPKLVNKYGADKIGTAGLGLVAIGMVGVAFFHVDTSYLQLVITMCVLAAGMAMTMTPMTTQLMAAVPRNRAGMGSATNDTTRELGGALGVAVLGSVLASQYTSGVSSAVAGLPLEAREAAEASIGGVLGFVEQAKGTVPQEQLDGLVSIAKNAFVDGLTAAAIVGAVVVALAAVAVKRYLPNDHNTAATRDRLRRRHARRRRLSGGCGGRAGRPSSRSTDDLRRRSDHDRRQPFPFPPSTDTHGGVGTSRTDPGEDVGDVRRWGASAALVAVALAAAACSDDDAADPTTRRYDRVDGPPERRPQRRRPSTTEATTTPRRRRRPRRRPPTTQSVRSVEGRDRGGVSRPRCEGLTPSCGARRSTDSTRRSPRSPFRAALTPRR